MEIRKISLIFKKAPFQVIMTIISFILFVLVYWFVTMRSIELYHPNNWNHGKLSLVAISKYRNEIIFFAEDW